MPNAIEHANRDRKFERFYARLIRDGVFDDDRGREIARAAYKAGWDAKPATPLEQTTWCASCLLGTCRSTDGHVKFPHRKEAVTVYCGDAVCDHCLKIARANVEERRKLHNAYAKRS